MNQSIINHKPVLWFLLCAVFLVSPGVWAKPQSQTLTAGDIERQTIQYLRQQLPWDEEQMEIDLKFQRRDLDLPEGSIKLLFEMSSRGPRLGNIPLSVKIRVDGAYQKMIRMQARVSVYQNLVQTTNSLMRGHVLDANDIELTEVKTTRPIRGALTRMEDALGFAVRRNMNAGDVVTLNNLKKPYLVKRGDRLLIVAERGGLKITVPGIAKDKGMEGSIIPIENVDTKKVVYGEVVNSKTARVQVN